MITTPTKWVRVTRGRACPVCGRTDWCSVAADGTACICPRTPGGKPISSKRTGEFVGYLHKLDGSTNYEPTPRDERRIPRHDIPLLARKYETAVNPERLERFASQIGLTVPNLRRLRIGWTERRAWSFPMRDEACRIIGIRLRTEDGAKFAVTGSENGLFIPDGIGGAPLVLCEGPTSCAALLDLGFATIGRPSCSGGGPMLVRLLHKTGRRDVVIFGDHDDAKPRPDGTEFFPGQEGAARLAQLLLPWARSVKVVVPPFAKDPRDWKQNGATRAVVDAVIRAANYVRPVQAIESGCL